MTFLPVTSCRVKVTGMLPPSRVMSGSTPTSTSEEVLPCFVAALPARKWGWKGSLTHQRPPLASVGTVATLPQVIQVILDCFLHLMGLLIGHDPDGELANHLARDHRFLAGS
ncbi:unnamed protein product, partial [Ixodes hexagonus]